MGLMNQQELKRLDDMTKQLKDLNKNIKDGNDLQKKVSSNTNKNTMQYELVKSVNSIASNLSALTDAVTKLTSEVSDIKGKIK